MDENVRLTASRNGAKERGLQVLAWSGALVVMAVVEAATVREAGSPWFIAALAGSMTVVLVALLAPVRHPRLLVRAAGLVTLLLGIVSAFTLGGALLLAVALLGLGDFVFGHEERPS